MLLIGQKPHSTLSSHEGVDGELKGHTKIHDSVLGKYRYFKNKMVKENRQSISNWYTVGVTYRCDGGYTNEI